MTENNAGEVTKILSPEECLSLLKNYTPASQKNSLKKISDAISFTRSS